MSSSKKTAAQRRMKSRPNKENHKKRIERIQGNAEALRLLEQDGK